MKESDKVLGKSLPALKGKIMPDETETYKAIKQYIDEWIPYTDNFTSTDIDREFNIRTRTAKQYRWRILEDYVKQGILEKEGKHYRHRKTTAEQVNWQEVDTDTTIDLNWPFALEQYIKVFPKSTIIVAGVPGTGKTAFFYNLIMQNMDHPLGITLFSNDMGAEEMQERFVNFETPIPSPPPWDTYERYDNFGDVIKPDGINIIDYLSVHDNFFLIGKEINHIDRKLRNGIAIIGIQKNPQHDLGLGGVYSLTKAKIYLTMDRKLNAEDNESMGWMTIKKARARANKAINPVGLTFTYKLVNGCKFLYQREERLGR